MEREAQRASDETYAILAERPIADLEALLEAQAREADPLTGRDAADERGAELRAKRRRRRSGLRLALCAVGLVLALWLLVDVAHLVLSSPAAGALVFAIVALISWLEDRSIKRDVRDRRAREEQGRLGPLLPGEDADARWARVKREERWDPAAPRTD
jgi:hypothetical protein